MSSPALTDLERLALFKLWNGRCVWCKQPIFFSEMEVEHLIPKSLAGRDLLNALRLHGLPLDYDVFAMNNLAPSCGPCNSGKGAKVPPDAAVVAMLLKGASDKSDAVSELAERLTHRRKLEEALAIVRAAASTDAGALAMIRDAVAQIATEVREETGSAPQRLHRAVTYLADQDRWEIVSDLGDDVVMVSDGTRAGRTGKHWSWECPHCGSYGPWNGNICLNCGRLDPGFDY
jgi:hypothetical protein